MTVLSDLGEFTEWKLFASGTKWVAYNRGLKRSVSIHSSCEEYCATSKVNLEGKVRDGEWFE